ncbi:DNRLRE domain-containing protein [Ferruginibacter lapsinanis]|uniref:DNRLRE domain-containing protein n=1 Tax=Ferruginibacter lapsinanis TaxID=563172 RepID=UPI001E4711AA|nr:DNRLRE domain-containing protein [Ferruginibacter lapsinanis]UEG49520.1 DNRLRE domain-containing protein [Ferruginibacter lapsinanis]
MKFFFYLFSILMLLNYNSFSQNVGIGTNTPNTSALLDISAADKGFLPPRVALQATDNPSPITTPATGLLVYNTAIAGVPPYNVLPGYYYWNGAIWYPITGKGNAYGDMQYWDGTKWTIIPIGNEGENLIVCNGKPSWGSCIKTLTLAPQNNPNEVYINSYSPNSSTSGISQLTIAAWTAGGVYYWRAFLKFDMSSIPANAIIQSAKLSLYSTTNPTQGNGVDAQFGGSNACYIQRVTSNWATNTITWNNQPTTTSSNQVTIPQSTSSFQDNIDMDVTDLVKDIVTSNNNYGFGIKLQSEVIYNARQYASSFNATAERHPKLVIVYTLP